MLTCGTLTINSETDKVDKINSCVRDFIQTETEKERTEFSSSRILFLKDVKINRVP